jgi:hypothetical protein
MPKCTNDEAETTRSRLMHWFFSDRERRILRRNNCQQVITELEQKLTGLDLPSLKELEAVTLPVYRAKTDIVDSRFDFRKGFKELEDTLLRLHVADDHNEATRLASFVGVAVHPDRTGHAGNIRFAAEQADKNR